MGLKDDLVSEVRATFTTQWAEEDATVVPDPEDLRLNKNHAKKLDTAVVLYADIDGSTGMVDELTWEIAAEVYKAYLRCASQIIKSEGGTITGYDGDRVMGIFVGNSKNSSAAKAALEINYAVENIIRPEFAAFYTSRSFVLKHAIGIDRTILRAARIGVHGDNDIVWVGRAANYAAKMCTLSERPIWITKAVYDNLRDGVKYSNGRDIWEKRFWTKMNNMELYASTWTWTVS